MNKRAAKIVPPAAVAEINAMVELSEKDIAELMRLATLFADYMRKKFGEIEGPK